jgi:hypothetical protein
MKFNDVDSPRGVWNSTELSTSRSPLRNAGFMPDDAEREATDDAAAGVC